MGISERIEKAIQEKRYVTNYSIKLALSLSKEGKIKLQKEARQMSNFNGFKGYSEFCGLPIYENEDQKEDFTIIKKI